MQTRSIQWSVLVLAIVFFALGNRAEAQRYHMQVYTESSGLPSAAIFSITQDESGLMCFGTRAGVVLYDGREWQLQDLPGLAHPSRYEVTRTPGGTVWAAEFAGHHSIFRREGERWIRMPVPSPRELYLKDISAFAVLGEGEQARILLCIRNGPAHLWNGDSWEAVLSDLGGDVQSVAVNAGRFVVIAAKALYTVDPEAPVPNFEPVPFLPPTEPFALAETLENESTLVVGVGWLGEMQAGKFQRIDGNFDFSPRRIDPRNTAAKDGRGGVYFGNQANVYYYHPTEGVELLGSQNGLSTGSITCSFRDREGLIWLGSLRGVVKVYPRDWVSYDMRHGFVDDEVTVITELQDGVMVFAHPGGLSFRGREPFSIRTSNQPQFERISSLVEGPSGGLYFSARGLGLLCFSRASRTATPINLPGGPGDPGDLDCNFVFFDAAGRLSVIRNQDVLRLTDGLWEELTLPAGADLGYKRQLIDGDNGALLVTTRKRGVVEAGVEAPRQWKSPSAALANDVFCLSRRPDGVIWAGTQGGLCKLVGDSLIETVELGGLAIERPIYFITDDKDGNVWFGTNHGALRWDGATLRHFTVHDGLLGAETNRGAGFCDSQGRMWIGTDRGASVFDPDRGSMSTTGPALRILIAGDQAERHDEHKSCGHLESTLIYNLRTISFVSEDQVRHRTWLEGLEEDWSQPRKLSSSQLVYPNLLPGEYRLHAVAIDINGRESAEAVAPWAVISPPLWNRPWFLALCALLVVALGGGAHAFLTKARVARRLEVLVAARTADLAMETGRLESMVANITDGVVLLDEKGQITLWNRAAEEITGWGVEESMGMSVERRFGASTVASRDGDGIVTVTIKSGARRTLESSVASIVHSPSGLSRVIAFRDVTERLRTEQDIARARHLESLGNLAGGLAHDFNNLLTVVRGNLSLLEDFDDQDGLRRGPIASINVAVRQAQGLTQQLITFSEGGEPVRKAEAFGPLLTESAKLVLAGSNMECRVEIADDLRPVEMDSAQMAQVLHNLCLNASQAMGAGGLISLRAYNACARGMADENPQVIVEVQDQGCGIEAEIVERIFEPYFSTKEEGTGLGLATSHSIVVRHGGSLSVKSEPGRGALFTICLPVALPVSEPGADSCHPSDAVPGALSILIMDDEDSVRDVTKSMLESLGHHCVVTSEGQGAVSEYRQALESNGPFDLVILDLTVPKGLGGHDALGQMTLLDRDVRAIVMSGYSTEPIVARHTEYGFRGRLSKPFGMDDLRNEIAVALA